MIQPGKPLLFSIALFPPVDYMALMLFGGEVVLEAHENYQKQSYRNRYVVQGPNGHQQLVVPVSKEKSGAVPVTEVNISATENWRQIHKRTLQTAYRKSPWYIHYGEQIETIINNPAKTLWDFASHALKMVSALLGHQLTYELSDRYIPSPENHVDVRELFHPKKQKVQFHIKPTENTYYQVFEEKHGFMHNLSVVDLLFNEGPLAYNWLKARYQEMVQNNTLPRSS